MSKFKVGDEVKLSEYGVKQFSFDNWADYSVPYSMSCGDYGVVTQILEECEGGADHIYVKNDAGYVYYYEDDIELVSEQQPNEKLREILNLDAPLGGLTGTQELVNSPKHYSVFDGIEAIEIIASSMTVEMFRGYCFGNLLKYRLRVGKKDNVQQELGKADKYEELFEKYKHLCKDSE